MNVVYEYKNGKYYKDKNEISEQQALNELVKYQYSKLKTNGICNVRLRDLDAPKSFNKDNVKYYDIKEKSILKANRQLYKTEASKKYNGEKFELWKKNKKYGYYNFICYIDNEDEDTINDAILKDIAENIDR